MGKYLINRDHGPVHLVKSKKLVGIKLASNREATVEQPDFVKEELLNHFGGFRLVTLNAADTSVDEKLDELRLNPEVILGTHVYFAEGSDTPVVPTGEIAITFEDGVSEEEQGIALEEFSLDLLERRAPYFVIVKVTRDSPNPIKVAQALQASLLVKVADPDLDIVLEEYDLIPQDDLINQQWQLKNNGFIPGVGVRLRAGADAKVFPAWQKLGHLGSTDLTLALIDTGFDLSHPDLKGKIVHPYNLFSRSSFLPQGDPRYTHGTPCASVALASANSSGIVGVAPNARFMPIHGTSFGDRDTEEMFDYCMQKGADIISCSWGTTDPAHRLNYRKEQAIRRAATQGRNGKGCVILFAAGNEGRSYLNFYAAHPNVIAVGAATSQDMHARYSNQGVEIDVVAPSSGHWPILAGRAWWDEGERGRLGSQRYFIDGISRGDHYKHFGGTSSSTPLVAGVCALILSANPELTAAEVKEILTQTADKIGPAVDYYRGHSRKYGYGRVNAEKAVAEALRRRENQTANEPSGTLGSAGSGSTNDTTSSGLFEVEVSDSIRMGWGVQIGAFSNYGGVMNLVNRLKRTYLEPVHVASVNRGGQVLYLVIVGSFIDINDARHLQRQLRAEFSGAFIKNLRDI